MTDDLTKTSVSAGAIAGIISSLIRNFLMLMIAFLIAVSLCILVMHVFVVLVSGSALALFELIRLANPQISAPGFLTDMFWLLADDWKRPMAFATLVLALSSSLYIARRFHAMRPGWGLYAAFVGVVITFIIYGLSGLAFAVPATFGGLTTSVLLTLFLNGILLPFFAIIPILSAMPFGDTIMAYATSMEKAADDSALWNAFTIGKSNILGVALSLVFGLGPAPIFYSVAGRMLVLLSTVATNRLYLSFLRTALVLPRRHFAMSGRRLIHHTRVLGEVGSLFARNALLAYIVCMVLAGTAWLMLAAPTEEVIGALMSTLPNAPSDQDAFQRLFLTTVCILGAVAVSIAATVIWATRWNDYSWFWVFEWAAAFTVTAVYIAAFASVEKLGTARIVVSVALPFALAALFTRSFIWQTLHRVLDHYRSRSQSELRDNDQLAGHRPVLYLRAFMDDKLALARQVNMLDLLMGTPRRKARFEEILAERAFHWRPIVALGNPHIPFQLWGVLKKVVGNDDWKSEVRFWRDHSSYLLMIGNRTENIGWEIDLIRSSGQEKRTIFVITSPARAGEFFSHYAILPDAMRAQIPPNALVVYHDFEIGWVVVGSILRTQVAYELALDIAIGRMELSLSRDAFQQDLSLPGDEVFGVTP